MKKLFALSAFAVFLLVSATPASAFELGVRASYWYAMLDAKVQADEGSTTGDELDLVRDLDMRSTFFPGVEVWAGIGKNIITLGYLKSDFTGEETLNQPITYNGDVYDAGLEISSALDIKILEVTYEYRILKLDAFLAGFDLGLLGNVKVISIDTNLENSAYTNTSDYDTFIPAVGIKAHFQILANILEARAIFLVGPIGHKQSGDLILDVSLTPFPFLDIHAGWRSMLFNIYDDDFEFKHQFDGPFIAVSLSW